MKSIKNQLFGGHEKHFKPEIRAATLMIEEPKFSEGIGYHWPDLNNNLRQYPYTVPLL